jgi:2-iminobutanoate/2-iminopropanoate deaminase
MEKKIITVRNLPAAGPYSTAVEANGFIFLSGQLPVNPANGEIIRDIKDATRQVLTNMQSVLSAAGLTMSDIVKTTIFLTSMADFPVVNETYSEFFPLNPPARSTIEVSNLPKGVSIEIEAIAVRN